MIQIINWLLKQIFYFRYLILRQGSFFWTISGPCHYVRPKDWTFYSASFDDLQWLKYLPWDSDKRNQDWNTYGIFKQQYGKFFFKAKLDGLVTDTSWPAIWLLELKNEPDHTWYYEIDIELMKKHFIYTIHVNHTGKKDEGEYYAVRSLFANRKFYRNLQKEYHLFLIYWSKDWIKMYINGILTACFKNEIHIPMQIICSKLSITKVIVK